MIAAATRVPDHGRLEPWRFILYRGEARVEIGKKLAALAEQREGPLPEGRRNQELARFSRAPLVIGVVSEPEGESKDPAMGNVPVRRHGGDEPDDRRQCAGLWHQLISNWYSDVPEGRAILGLAPHERVVGFVHIGSFAGPAPERPRPDPAKLYADYSGPVGRLNVFYEPSKGMGCRMIRSKAIVAPRRSAGSRR